MTHCIQKKKKRENTLTGCSQVFPKIGVPNRKILENETAGKFPG